MSGRYPISELTKDFTEERWQRVTTMRAPSEKERKPKMSVSVSSYLQKTRLLPTPPAPTPWTRPVTLKLYAMADGWYREGKVPHWDGLDCLATKFSDRYPKERKPKMNLSAVSSVSSYLWKTRTHPTDPLDVPSRLREFRAMADGWYEGEGVAPCTEGLDWFTATFTRYYPSDIPLPHTYPTPKGGIEMEWSIYKHSVILEVDLSTHQGDYLEFDDGSDVENTRTLDLDSADGWIWMIDNIRQLTERPK